MSAPMQHASRSGEAPAPVAATLKALKPAPHWHDPLGLIQAEPPSQLGRIVLWSVAILTAVMILWAAIGQLDIIASAEGKLVPDTLLKVVQPAEPGVVQALLVKEGDAVHAGQVLARLNPTIASAERVGIAAELASQRMQVRRIEAELADLPLASRPGDDALLYAQVLNQYRAHKAALSGALEHEQALLEKASNERKSAAAVLAKLETTLPTYMRASDAYLKLEKEGFLGGIVSAEKQREAVEKSNDLEAQRATVAASNASIAAQQKRIAQMQSSNQAELQRELAELRARIAQLEPSLNRSTYREGLMELRAPQDGVIKDLATTTIGAVVQPGTVILTLVPNNERLYAEVSVKNEDMGFVRIGQRAKIKLATYPFQKYGMLTGEVVLVSEDATDIAAAQQAARPLRNRGDSDTGGVPTGSTYKARVRLDNQTLRDPHGNPLKLSAGLQVVAEINQGTRTVLDYLLSPVQKTLAEAGRER